MIKMYVMHTCPDCEYVEKQVEGNPNFEIIDIGKHVRNLKQFLDLRDSHPAFDTQYKPPRRHASRLGCCQTRKPHPTLAP